MERFDIVDENGQPTGDIVTREEAHKRGIRHRTSHVWLLRKRGDKVQVLLQQRSLDKDSFPGCYDISSAGHIPAGDGFMESALRELREELGIEARADELVYCGQRRFEVREVFNGQPFWDNQVSNVYALWRETEAEKFVIQTSEIQKVIWMDWDKCIDMVKNMAVPHCIWLPELEMVAAVLI